jgi:DNA excision repair protein ERCC-2
MPLFPYAPRPQQEEIVRVVSRAVETRTPLVLESGTGTGKTVCSLCGVLDSLPPGGRLLYLTRTNSQQTQVMRELRSIRERRSVFGMGLQGRKSTCPLVRSDPELRMGNPEELSRLCGERKKRTLADSEGGCSYYKETISVDFHEIEHHCKENLPTVEEFVDYCERRKLCPYELMKELVREAEVLTAPYAYFFVPFIRRSLLDWMNVDLGNLVVIVDEAHNLPDYAREIMSITLSERTLQSVHREVDEYGDPEVMTGVSVMDLVMGLGEILSEAVDEYLIDDDGLIPPGFLEEGLMSRFKATSRQLSEASNALRVHGEIIREERKQRDRLPRSYIHALGSFLEAWSGMEQDRYVKLVLGGESVAFQSYCLDPSHACAPLGQCRTSIHMSGTLRPLGEYRDSIGLPLNTLMKEFPSPFPPRNRGVFFTPHLTTRYEELAMRPEMVVALEEETVRLINALDRNTAVFFPSYSLMERFLSDGVEKRIRREVHLERRGMSQSDLMEVVGEFREGKESGAVLLAVMGGRISEGLDFPDRDLEAVVLVGLPFPKPTARQRALLHYYEMKFGRGWEYTVKAPTCRKMLQAIGRLIRRESDVGVAVILDHRAQQFSSSVELVEAEHPVSEVLRFFRERAG